MNIADTAAVDLACLLHVQALPSKKHKYGKINKVIHYSPKARAYKKQQRVARKRNNQ